MSRHSLLCLTLVAGISAQVPELPLPPRWCWQGVLPAATLPTQPGPVFCMAHNMGADTARSFPNAWFDPFDHGPAMAHFGNTRYRVFEQAAGLYDSQHFRHADHWMVDIAPLAPGSNGTTWGGAVMRPDRSFRFEKGRLVIETDFAAGHQDYLPGQAWGEIVITTANAPGGFRRNGALYGYDLFPGHFTLGCRLQPDRIPICALMDASDQSSIGGGRIWEMSFFQPVGQTNYGGYPQVTDPPVWRLCRSGMDADMMCRDRFRLELTATSVTLWVNGVRYFEQTGIPRLPEELLNQEVYVYLASMVYRSSYQVLRFHWDRLAVNPQLLPEDLGSLKR